MAVSSFVSPEWIGKIIIAVGVCFSGYRVVIKGLKTLCKLKLDENVLMMIAVVASCVLGEFFEAAAVTILSISVNILKIRLSASQEKVSKHFL